MAQTAFVIPLGMFFPLQQFGSFFGQWGNLFIWISIGFTKGSKTTYKDFLILKDVTETYILPNITDIKIGFKTWGPDMTIEKRIYKESKPTATRNAFGFIEVFRWEPSTDTFEFPGYMNTYLLENVVAVKRGLAPNDARSIYKDIERRAKILKRLQERGTTNFYELHNIISKAYREGQF